MNIFSKTFCGILLVLLSAGSWADIKVIVHTSVSDNSITADHLSAIFLGKNKALPSGAKITPVDQAETSDNRNAFYSNVVQKDRAQMKAYWSRLIFTGKGTPPKAVYGDDEVIGLVKSNPDFIGYVSGSANTAGTKVIFSLP